MLDMQQDRAYSVSGNSIQHIENLRLGFPEAGKFDRMHRIHIEPRPIHCCSSFRRLNRLEQEGCKHGDGPLSFRCGRNLPR
jgi:hypothetical protein